MFDKVELDHWHSAGGGANDIIYDHVAVHSAGRGGNTSALSSSELVPPRVWELADGKHHLVKVRRLEPWTRTKLRFVWLLKR